MIPNLAGFVENLIKDFDGYVWDLRYGDYIIGQTASVKHLGAKVYEDFSTSLTEPEVLNSFECVISKPLLIQSLNSAIVQVQAANGGILPPPPAPQYTLSEALSPNNVFWQLKNNEDRTDWFPVRIRRIPLVKTWDYRIRFVEKSI